MASNPNDPVLSNFGDMVLRNGGKALVLHHVMRDTYKKYENEQGVINLAVAENTLMHEELREYFEGVFDLRALDFTYGDGLSGTKRLCDALSEFLNQHFHPWKKVEPKHLLLGCGLITIVGQIGRAVANPGDGILITAPYYGGFDVSFAVEHGLKPVSVKLNPKDVGTLREVDALEEAILESRNSGTAVKAVLLCNPHNPLGRCYSREALEAYCRFCEKHNIHLVSDEIFAMSVFPSNDFPRPPPFISVLSLDCHKLGVNPSRIHCLYGMSKDFNANGFRAGVLASPHNPELINCLTITNMFSVIASPTDALWSALLNDAKFLSQFFVTNRSKLAEAYEYVTAWLTFHTLPYIPVHAAHFLMVDWRPVLSDVERYGDMLLIKPSDSMEKRELALAEYILSRKVYLSPGSEHHFPEGGWVRLSFSVRRDYLNIGLRRIEEGLGWDRYPGLQGLHSVSSNHGEKKSSVSNRLGNSRAQMKSTLKGRMKDFSLIPFVPCLGVTELLERTDDEHKG
ncbi:PLP-dependent transferase [Marasmius fiardii PR-910]|nr:PLP-dependent transferase [Marasmius fiardii PR-910]